MHDKTKRECYIIDVACPFDTRVKDKEKEKIERYQDLKREISRIWECRKVTTGALGTIPKGFKKWAEKIHVYERTDLIQKTCVLGTAKIIRRTLDT